MFKYNVLAP